MTMSRIALVALIAALAPGCEDKPPTPVSRAADSADKDAGLDSPAVGGKMKDVQKTLEGTGLSAEELAKQPPPNGIFPAGVADKAHAPNAPPKLEIFQEGEEPRIQLHASAPEPQTMAVQLQYSLGAAPNVRVFFVEIGAPGTVGKGLERISSDMKKKLKDLDAEAGGAAKPSAAPSASAAGSAAAEAPSAAAPSGDRELVAKIVDFSQSGALGSSLDAEIAFTVTKGGATNFKTKLNGEPAKEGDPRVFELSAIEEMVFALYTGVPDKPVGANGAWTISDRRTSFGSDVVRYRLFQVEKIEGDVAHLQLMVRQYAATDTSSLIQEPGLVLRAYTFEGRGKLTLGPKMLLPQVGTLDARMAGQVVPSDKKADPSVQGKRFNVEAGIQIVDAATALAQTQAAGKGRKGGGAPSPGAPPGGPAPAPQPPPPPPQP